MSDLDALYQQTILDHARARSGGDLPESQTAAAPGLPGTGQSHQLNPVCGDEITLRVEVDGGKVTAVRWNGAGCAISMASASVLSELAEGLVPKELQGLIENFRELMRSRGRMEADEEVLGDAAALSGVSKYPARVKCAMLSWVAAEDALQQAVTTS
ncbi:Fe-S cluster assembly sulfur transfer protein SufU [Paenarthrobacter sp. PH39-S1]|uniref:Fe-S cluster assembly sulfur transfer protein SufU n=1 Tax=Paenarthrobacter sp. PH39-S1 TaxID=3046204 RepID=UPI0024B8FBDC|nr:SUF system NifU family Fe-S cluster assembly protein [Paenarthrobacter sp. PH39-S1]MDJ0356109.1 SUF system NifU family Fe-S cluster assembly protein [Paenarthrobacter sp. PH39-S1]